MIKVACVVAFSLLTIAVQAQAAKRGKEITCSPKVLYPGDTLTIKTNQPFRYLGVTQPIKKSPRTLLVYPITGEADKHSMIDVDQFGSQKKLTLPVGTANAWFVDANGGAMQPVFPKAGSYIFEVGNSLGNSSDKTPYRCIVKYVLY